MSTVKPPDGRDEAPTADAERAEVEPARARASAAPAGAGAESPLAAGSDPPPGAAAELSLAGQEPPWFSGTVELVPPGRKKPAAPPPPPADDTLRAGERRPWLMNEGQIAEGGMGSILKVLDRKLRRRAALKALVAGKEDEQARVRFVEEAQITAQLDHPNIPPVHDLWLDASGNLCFTMKLVRGRTLTAILAEREPGERTDRELEDLLKVFLKVCDAVSFAHSRGVIHRDLKSDNVMVGTHGQVYVMDWGCALLLAGAQPGEGGAVSVARDPETQPLDPPGVVVGTCAYMAPEQALALSAQIDEHTDVFLLGALLYEILTRRPPHRGASFRETLDMAQNNVIPDPQEVVAPARLPPELCRIAMRAMETDPGDRYGSVDELKEDIERSLRSGFWFTSRTFPAGAQVIREGDAADAAFIITEGTCEAFRTENGARVSLRRMGAGDVFGETAIFTAQPRTASVEALEPLTVTVVTREALERAVSGEWWMGAFVRALAERFRELDGKLARMRQGGE